MVKRILVALSGTRYTDAAITYALELAHAHGAEITGVTDVDSARIADVGPVPIEAGAAAHDLVEQRWHDTEKHIERVIGRFETMCKEQGVSYAVHREIGEPYEHLTELWRYYDLTIAGLQGLFEYEVLHKPDDVLIRLIGAGVRPILAVAAEHRAIHTVLIAYNGSMESAKTMKRFVQMHLWPNMKLKLACFEMKKSEGEKLLADAASYCHAHDYEPETEWIEGSAREGLLECAKRMDADLIVMGSTARSRIVRKLLGDTALHAIRNAEIPLFLAQ
jgi:nucleotide-binding universal stress UspA family protein